MHFTCTCNLITLTCGRLSVRQSKDEDTFNTCKNVTSSGKTRLMEEQKHNFNIYFE